MQLQLALQAALAYNGSRSLIFITSMTNAIDRAISEFDSLSDMARQLGVSYQVIQDWRKRNIVPAEHCPVVERLTAGKIRCEELNSTIDWTYLRGTEQTAAA
jgi:DNA-binding transcriptional regulator YdaS (Cro superfamily)